MQEKKCYVSAFGTNSYGLVDFPKKISGTAVSRIELGDALGCSRCFPHGYETVNARYYKIQRSWKSHRKNQWK